MNKKQEFYSLLHTLRRGYDDGTHTYGSCMNKCGESARGSGLCPNCCESELGKLIGSTDISYAIHKSIKQGANVIQAALYNIKKMEVDNG